MCDFDLAFAKYWDSFLGNKLVLVSIVTAFVGLDDSIANLRVFDAIFASVDSGGWAAVAQ